LWTFGIKHSLSLRAGPHLYVVLQLLSEPIALPHIATRIEFNDTEGLWTPPPILPHEFEYSFCGPYQLSCSQKPFPSNVCLCWLHSYATCYFKVHSAII
jgi:hypothetical protein